MGIEVHNQTRLRLEEEYRERLAGIQDATNANSVQSVLAGGAQIASALGAQSKKAVKIASAAGAAQALISTYIGAAKEIEKGTFGFATAAAVIAKGTAFVAAIEGAGASQGGGGVSASGSVSAAPAAAEQQAPQRITLQGLDPKALFTGEMISNVFDGIFDENKRRGGVIVVST